MQRKQRTGRLGLALLVVGLLVFAGCATTRNEAFLEADKAVAQGRFEDAAGLLGGDNRDRVYSQRDKVLYYLDVGMLQHYAGNYTQSIEHLQEAERLIEELFTRSVSQAAGSLLLNDTVQDYAGEDYEDIYLNVFNAISFLRQGDFEGAFVEVRRINIKLNLLRDKYQRLADEYSNSEEADVSIEPGESRFYNSALARYLSMVMYRADGDYDGARIDYQSIQEAFARQSNIYTFANPLTAAALERTQSPRLSLLAFTGRAPVKRADTLYVITLDNEVVIRIEREVNGRMVEQDYDRFYWPNIKGGYRFKFQVPRMEMQGSQVDQIRVYANGQLLGQPALLEDMQRVALETFNVRLPIIYLKTVTRTIVKGIVAQEAKERMQSAGQSSGSTLGLIAGIVGSIATDIAVDASEQADLRSSRYFPAFAYVGEWQLPPGQHHIRVEYGGGKGQGFVDDLGMVEVRPSGLNLVTSYLIQ